MKLLGSFVRLLDYHVLLVAALAILATYVCIRLNISADLPSSLIAVAIVFPIVFSINAAYRRREQALSYLAAFKSYIVALYFAHRDWVGDDQGARLGPQAHGLGLELYESVKAALAGEDSQRETASKETYAVLSRYSKSHEEMRAAGLAATEVSRINNYLRGMIFEFERMQTIAKYRTPAAMRAFSKVYLNVFPLLYAPLYAQIAADAGLPFGFGVATAFAFVLVGLDNVQDRLEDPFDGIGDDDVRFDGLGEFSDFS